MLLLYKLQLFLDMFLYHAFLEFGVPVCTCKIEKYDEIWYEMYVNGTSLESWTSSLNEVVSCSVLYA